MRILLVEDEPRLAATVARGLRDEGHAVETAFDGRQALDIIAGQDFDLIVLDVMLPELNGYQVLRTVRQEGNWTPVLMLTAKDGDHEQADALDLGADDYLTKPFSFVVLLARARALLRRRPVERPAVLSVGDLRLDPGARTVVRASTEITLTRREFALLSLLMSRAGDVLSKSEILEQVWDLNYDRPENVVEVYIGYLRRKIDEPFGVRTIHTVRGFGYRLEPGDGGEVDEGAASGR